MFLTCKLFAWNIYELVSTCVCDMTTYLLVICDSQVANGHITVDCFNRHCLHSEWTKCPAGSLVREVTGRCLRHKQQRPSQRHFVTTVVISMVVFQTHSASFCDDVTT